MTTAAAKSGAVPGRAELRDLVDGALRELDADDRGGPLVRAAGLSMRIEITDLDLVVRVAPGDGDSGHLAWNFSDEGPAPKLDLQMDSATAHGYLLGDESLAIAIAKGRVCLRGESRFALLYLPIMRRISSPYRRLVGERFPHLAAT